MTDRTNWEQKPLGEVVRVVKSSAHPEEYGDSTVDYYSLPIFDRTREPEVVSAESIKSLKRVIDRPLVLVSRLNPHIPRVWRAEPSDRPALASTEFAPLEPTGVRLDYLYAAVSSSTFQRELMSRVTGTSTSHQRVKLRDLLALPIPVPPPEDQERIGGLVAALDRRRSLAEALSATREDLLQQLFRHHFPNAFEGTARFGDYTNITMGVSYRSSELGGEDQALVTLKSFGRTGSYQDAGLKPWSGEAKPEQYVEEGDVVVAHTDLTQAAEVLGRAVVVRRSRQYERLAASLDMAVVRPRPPLSREYVLGLTRQPEFRHYCRAHANGTTVLHLSRKALPKFRFSPPSETALRAYDEAAALILGRHLTGDEERRTAERLRDRVLDRVFAD